MGRGKVELKLIEDKGNRQVSFSKRRNGLFKKARELSVLCDAEVAVAVFSKGGRFYEFSTANCWYKILELYRRHPDSQKASLANVTINEEATPTEICRAECAASGEENNILHAMQRFSQWQNIEQLKLPDVVQLEQRLDAALAHIGRLKAQVMIKSVSALHEADRSTSFSSARRADNMMMAELNNEEDHLPEEVAFPSS